MGTQLPPRSWRDHAEARRHARRRRLFAALCVSYTAIVGAAFWLGTCRRGAWHVRTRADWANTILLFAPMFAAMHAAGHAAYSCLADQQPAKKLSAHWFASHVVSMAHALVVTAAALSSLFLLWDAPPRVKLGSEPPASGSRWVGGYPMVAATGELFSAWLVYDLLSVIGAWATLGSWETVAHHIGFFAAAGLLRGFYFAPWQATVCLCMEASTPFLNVCQLKEAFGLDKRSAAIVSSFALFALNFFFFRIVLLGGALAQLLAHWAEGPWAEPARRAGAAAAPPVPRLAAYGLLCLLCAALALMVAWFRRIVAILLPSGGGGAEEARAGDGPRHQPARLAQLSDDEELALVAVT